MADWYYAKNGKQHGPITSAQLRQMAQSGELQPDDLVFKEGGTNWIAASTVAGLFAGGGGGRATTQPRQQQGGQGFDFDAGGRRDDRDDDDRDEDVAVRRAGRKGSYWGELLMFRRMIAPTIIIILFWLGVAGAVIGGLVMMVMGLVTMVSVRNGALPGLGMIVAGILLIPFYILLFRLYGELMIVVFRINENLLDIKEGLEQRDKS